MFLSFFPSMGSDEVVSTVGNAQLDGLDDILLGEDGALAVAHRARPQVLADVDYIH